jgi:transcriptional regulator with PAS, ATPase and Fis domain
MDKKRVVLITGTERTRVTLLEQLKSCVGDFVSLESYALDLGIRKRISADLVVVSTSIIYDEVLEYLEKNCPVIVARRVINYSAIEKMLVIPSGEKILFVNDCEETTFESIQWLKRLGLDSYKYIPLYPGISQEAVFRYAVTPGETHLVPSYIANIIDIGPRLMDITTISEILTQLSLFKERWDEISTIYLSKIITMGKKLAEESREKSEAYNHVIKVIDSVNEGLLAYSKDEIITVFNENLKYMLGIRKNKVVGKKVSSVLSEESLYRFIINSPDNDSGILVLRGEEFIVNKFSIKEDGITVIIFKNKNCSLEGRKELYKKGYYGKYDFDNIIGESTPIKNVKAIANKLALAELTVLIEGESGTGKELFASAIHNCSNRRDKPFVAVNFSSLSESLVESELFGYEEGAFTGAVKGGKQGLFEQANGGTIFLDEIGDISLKVQTRLLRVLQEKEVMRVGGNKIIPVDVRIIAATNANLNKLVLEGKFRADLYHRIKVLYVRIPPLRERREDIIPILKHFLSRSGKENIVIDEKVVHKLLCYNWRGNIRELKNTFDYMLQFVMVR